mmetsp:Transcript_7412/g.22580  ORF Transcript_7412/g.22580 Transcript_7412/m.22580 type:complete len:203 (+) Transcript_7412:1201-1809(+)
MSPQSSLRVRSPDHFCFSSLPACLPAAAWQSHHHRRHLIHRRLAPCPAPSSLTPQPTWVCSSSPHIHPFAAAARCLPSPCSRRALSRPGVSRPCRARLRRLAGPRARAEESSQLSTTRRRTTLRLLACMRRLRAASLTVSACRRAARHARRWLEHACRIDAAHGWSVSHTPVPTGVGDARRAWWMRTRIPRGSMYSKGEHTV